MAERPPSQPSSKPPVGRLLPPPVDADSALEEEALRLESRPSPGLPMVLAGVLSCITLTAVVASAVVEVDQIVSLPGKLVTRRSTQSLTTSNPGVVTQVLVKEGDRVRSGQPLVVLDPRVQRSDVTELTRQVSAESDRLASELAQIEERVSGLKRQEAIDRRILEPLKRLALQGGAPFMQVAEKERELENTRRQLAEARRELAKVRFQSQRSQAELRARLVDARSKLNLVTLRAPVTGTVINLQAQTGQVVNGASPLLKLVPADVLQAQVFAPNQELAFIRVGQSADVAFTAYDRSRYGMLPATVAMISEDALPPSPEYNYPNFPVKLNLKRQVLEARGQQFDLQPGMALQAQIKLEKRTILQMLFSRVNQTLDAVRSVR